MKECDAAQELLSFLNECAFLSPRNSFRIITNHGKADADGAFCAERQDIIFKGVPVKVISKATS